MTYGHGEIDQAFRLVVQAVAEQGVRDTFFLPRGWRDAPGRFARTRPETESGLQSS